MPIKSINHPAADFNNQYWRSGPEAAGAPPPGAMDASGGNITATPGNGYTYHIFTSSGSLVVSALNGTPGNVEYVVVGVLVNGHRKKWIMVKILLQESI